MAAATVDGKAIRPFSAAVILEAPNLVPADAITRLGERVKEMALGRSGRDVEIVASGLVNDDSQPEGAFLDGIDAIVVKRSRAPRWWIPSGGFSDVEHELVVWAHRGGLFAVACNGPLREALLRWLDEVPPPPFRRIADHVLEAAFLRGETKGLWLRGAHPRRSSKPDSKSIGGQKLQDALDPHGDSTFILGSGKAVIPDDPSRTGLVGAVGTTPRHSLFWHKQATDLASFKLVVAEALLMVEDEIANGVTQPTYPELATAGASLHDVKDAFDLSFVPSDEQAADTNTDVLDALDYLDSCLLEVENPGPKGTFDLRVGIDGAISGSVRVRPVMLASGVRFEFGTKQGATDPRTVSEIRTALEHAQGSITVRYGSGHAVTQHGVIGLELRDSRFRQWEFFDFAEFDVSREKPFGESNWQAIHDRIGESGDDSLFAWVVSQCTDGWLSCDDGPGEVADFVHLDRNSRLRLIHCKGAETNSPGRGIAAAAYEGVVGQAKKNLVYADTSRLLAQLMRPPVERPACWIDGVPAGDRSAMLAELSRRPSNSVTEVIVVQPHVREAKRSPLIAAPGTSQEHLRLRLLETLLVGTRSAVVALCDEFRVWSST